MKRITISEFEYNFLKAYQESLEEVVKLNEEIVAMFEAGKTTEEVENALGVSIDTINKTYDERLNAYAYAMYNTIRLK